MLNLIPISQLDGGHVAIAFFGNSYGRASQFLRKMLLPLAVAVTLVVHTTTTRELARAGISSGPSAWKVATLAGMQWLVWYVMLGLLRRVSGGIDHPPVDDRPLPRSRAVLFWSVAVSFVLTFMPVPIRTSVGTVSRPPVEAASVAP
jgi:membrane-associated protease RseP (regulator of RpoE activity)